VSGVEHDIGKKDRAKLASFIESVRHAEQLATSN
jgi:phosphoribosylanthranilate isomerase